MVSLPVPRCLLVPALADCASYLLPHGRWHRREDQSGKLKMGHDSSSAAPSIQRYSPRFPDSRAYFSTLFLPFLNYPCIDAKHSTVHRLCCDTRDPRARHLWYRYSECTACDAPNPLPSRLHSATCPLTATGVSPLA